MKNMRVYILRLGDMYSDSIYNIMGDTAATVADPTASHQMLHTPSSAPLIYHPEAGWILFGTGIGEDPKTEWPSALLDWIVVQKSAESQMKHQLGLVGLKPEDIKYIITSHLHMDHIGNDKLFAETAEFFEPKEDAAYTYRMVMQSPDPNSHGAYVKNDVLLARKKITYLGRDEELFSGIEVITLPGHTPCTLGLVVHLESGTLIFTSDAVAVHQNYEGQMPGGVYDSLGYVESIRKIKNLQKKYNAKVFFSHDTDQIKQVKLAPDYYE